MIARTLINSGQLRTNMFRKTSAGLRISDYVNRCVEFYLAYHFDSREGVRRDNRNCEGTVSINKKNKR